MKPENIVFLNTFNTYQEAEEHWNKLKEKEKYGIGSANSKQYFLISVDAINVIFNEMKTKISDEEITALHLKCWNEIEFARAIEERHGIK